MLKIKKTNNNKCIKKIVSFDPKHIYHNISINKKNITFFYFNKTYQYTNNTVFKRPGNFQKWEYLCSRIFGMNKGVLNYIIPFLGYNQNILYTNVDEYYFITFFFFLKRYSSFVTISWFLVHLRQRTFLLPFLSKGLRFLKKLPCRGQRTRSNNRTSRKLNIKKNLFTFKKKLNKRYIAIRFPSWGQIESFYFYRY